jgi:LacI family transcriptional regulator
MKLHLLDIVLDWHDNQIQNVLETVIALIPINANNFMQVKLKDLAAKTGYSITTVSRALAGYSDVSEKTRQQIMAVANSLGYQPNMVARQLRSQRTHTLGLIIPANERSFSNDFFSLLMMAVGDAAAPKHYDLLISAQVPGEEEMAAYQKMVGGNRVDGMILARSRRNDPRIAYLKTQNLPFAVSGRAAPGEVSDFPHIDVDSQAGIRCVVEHFIGLGHRAIGLILPPDDVAYTGYRHQGYRDALAQASLPYRSAYVITGDLLRSGGYQGAQALLDRHPELTAIVACNDLMALGAMSAIQGRGLQVGQDVAVAGFDDIPAAEYAHPSLTTIHQPIYEIGQRLFRMLIGIIEGASFDETQIILPTRLIIRASSGGFRE